MNDIEKRARELLAEASGWNVDDMVEHFGSDVCLFTADEALEAVRAALAPPEGYVLVPVDQLPMQPVVLDAHGRARFRENSLVRALLDHGISTGLSLNELAIQDHGADDRMQLAQLIGYSVYGYGTLSYVTDVSYEEADRRADMLAGRPEVSP